MSTIITPADAPPRRPWSLWQRRLLHLAGVVALLLFAWLVWPTPYEYFGDYGSGLVRVHRVTGKAELLTKTGWEKLEPNPFADVLHP